MAVAALITNTRSPEPPNSALLNFMKGLAVQFMSLTAEDVSERPRAGTAPPLQMRLKQDQQKFYPWQHYFFFFSFLSFHAENVRLGWKQERKHFLCLFRVRS